MRYRMLAAGVPAHRCLRGQRASTCAHHQPVRKPDARDPFTITASPADLANDITWSSTSRHPLRRQGADGRLPSAAVDPAGDGSPRRARTDEDGDLHLPISATSAAGNRADSERRGQRHLRSVRHPAHLLRHQNDCYAVQGYIQAQDRLFQLDFFRRAAEGRAAELVGHALLDQDKQFLALFATRDGERIETKLAAALDVDTKAKVDAFVSGVNAYLTVLRQTPTLMPQEYAQISAGLTPADIPDWSAPIPRGGTAAAVPGVGIDHEGDFLYLFCPDIRTGPLADAGRVSAYLRPVQPIQAFPLAPTDPTSIPGRPRRAAGGYRCRIGARAGTAPCADARATRVFPDPEHQSRPQRLGRGRLALSDRPRDGGERSALVAPVSPALPSRRADRQR